MAYEFDSNDVMAYIHDYCAKNNIYVNVTKLQKLLYCCYGVVLAALDERLTSEHPQAWEHGPVFPRTFNAIKKQKLSSYGIRAIAKLEGSHRKLFCNFAVFAKPDAPLNDRPFAHLPTPIFAPVRPSTRKSSPANRGRFPESLLSRDSAEFLIWVSSADVLPDQFS